MTDAVRAEFANSIESIHTHEEHILQAAQACGYEENDLFALRLALDEALINAYRHGNKKKPEARILLEYRVDPKQIEVTITDEGEGFDHSGVDDPRKDSHLRRTHGRGVFLIRQFMSEISFNDKGNQIRFVYRHEAV